jgi:hypothetical protein
LQSADSFHDGGLQFLAVGAAEIELVAGETNGDGIAGLPFAGGVAIGGGGIVFTRVDHAFNIDNDRAANQVRGRFAKDLGFGLVPVFVVATFDGSAPLVEFGGAAADSLLHLRRVVPGVPRHIRIASRIQSC